jgi:Tol biopolymer transport system component
MLRITTVLFILSGTFDSGDNLTRSTADERYPSWSPDGTKILFESFRNGNWDVFCLDLKDRKETNLPNIQQTIDPLHGMQPVGS